jgi:hypothetical protein
MKVNLNFLDIFSYSKYLFFSLARLPYGVTVCIQDRSEIEGVKTGFGKFKFFANFICFIIIFFVTSQFNREI